MRTATLALLLLPFLFGAQNPEAPPEKQDPERRKRPPSGPRSNSRELLDSWAFRRGTWNFTAFTGVNVIDIRTGAVAEGVNLLVDGDVIQSISKESPPPGATVIDVAGRYVIPGLMDLHAHVIPEGIFGSKKPEETLEILLRHGVTTIRLIPLVSESAIGLAARVHTGKIPGPTIVPASTVYEKEPQRSTRGFGDPETARAWVRRDAWLGVRWIKVYNKMDAPSLRAIVDTAHSLGLQVCGHSHDVRPRESAPIGLDTVEHIVDVPRSCLPEGMDQPKGMPLIDQVAFLWKNAEDARCRSLMELFRKHDTGWVPTLAVTEKITEVGTHDGVPPANPESIAGVRHGIARAAKLAVEHHRAGGRVGLGTDFPIDGVQPGSSAHRELVLFVEQGGATPLEALQIGTIGSARILGFDALVGSLEPGKLADFVVLGKNPLDDIDHLDSIEIVVHDGRIYDYR